MTSPREGRPSNTTVFMCYKCGYERDVTSIVEKQVRFIEHPVYGRVTVLEAAKLDGEHHNCDEYLAARARLRTNGVRGLSRETLINADD